MTPARLQWGAALGDAPRRFWRRLATVARRLPQTAAHNDERRRRSDSLGASASLVAARLLRMEPSDTQPLQRVLVDKSDAEPVRPPGYIRLGAPLPIRIPTRPEEITVEWLTDTFRFKGYLMRDGRVVSLSMKAIGEGQGAFGDLVLVTVTFEGGRLNAPTTFVAKFAPMCTGTVKRLETRVIFLNEAHFYNDFTIQDGACARPECYLVACEPRRSEPTFCFLLENMLPATTWTRTEGCSSLPHLQMVMRMLARFHARWWGQHPNPDPRP